MVLLIFAVPIVIAAALRIVLLPAAQRSARRAFRHIAVIGGGAIGALGLSGGLLISATQPNSLMWAVSFTLLIGGAGGVVFVSCSIAERVLAGWSFVLGRPLRGTVHDI
jgi:hypothetical protein